MTSCIYKRMTKTRLYLPVIIFLISPHFSRTPSSTYLLTNAAIFICHSFVTKSEIMLDSRIFYYHIHIYATTGHFLIICVVIFLPYFIHTIHILIHALYSQCNSSIPRFILHMRFTFSIHLHFLNPHPFLVLFFISYRISLSTFLTSSLLNYLSSFYDRSYYAVYFSTYVLHDRKL